MKNAVFRESGNKQKKMKKENTEKKNAEKENTETKNIEMEQVKPDQVKTEPLIGPFFLIGNQLIVQQCLLSKGRKQADKLDNSYGHEQLYDDYFSKGDYIDYPRGRVIWDLTNDQAIIYLDPCIHTEAVLKRVASMFRLERYTVQYDEHYHCKNCVGDLWN